MADIFKTTFENEIFRNIYGSSFFTASLVIFMTVLLIFWKFKRNKYRFPPGPIGFPFLGYLPFLGPEPFRDFDRLKEKYGNVFSLYMGPAYVVILGDYEAMKDAYSKSETLHKPPKSFDFLPDAIGFSSNNGEEWAEQRRFCVRLMRDLGIGKDRWESNVQAEIEEFLNFVSSFKGQPVDIFDSLTSSVSNNITAFMFGNRLPYDHPDRKLLDYILEDALESFDQTALHNFFPILRDISVALGIGAAAQAHRKLVTLNNFVRKQVEKMKLCYKSGEQENFIVDYLKAMDSCKDKPMLGFTDRNLYGNIQGLFLGGSDTTRTSIYWLLLIMAEHQDIQNKVQKELDSVLGKDRQVKWSDRKDLPFTIAVIMEGQRWRSIAPLNSARMATEDIKIQGYDILKGTTILLNNWGLHNDKRYWKNPEQYIPERFLTEDGKEIKTKPESYNPFSYGRRNCPGETIAMMDILNYFAALIQKFRVMPPKNKKINFKGKVGLTYQAENQDLIFLPRE